MFALDADLDELHAVSFDKGCYVGQELTARMKHRGTARKRLLPRGDDGRQRPARRDAPVTADGQEIGADHLDLWRARLRARQAGPAGGSGRRPLEAGGAP